MTTTITADNVFTFTNRALVIAKALLQDAYVEMTTRYLRHGWSSGFEAYTAEKASMSDTIEIINDELHKRYAYDQAMNKALDETRAAVTVAA